MRTESPCLLFSLCMSVFLACTTVCAQTWETVTQPITEHIASNPLVNDAGLLVMRHGSVLHEQYWGTQNEETSIKMASASKLLAAVAIMSLVDEGLLDLDSPVSSYLPAEFPAGTLKGTMTVRQMFSHTAGLPGQSPFVDDSSITLAEAAARIGQSTPLLTIPGTRFSYGGVSMQVAGRVAEVVSGQSWKTLFDERVARPLGLTATDWNALGITDNPRIGGGARSSIRDFSRVLLMLLNQGLHEGSLVLTPSSVATILCDQTNDASVGFIPGSLETFLGYGIGVWIELNDPETGVPLEFTSPGGAGTTPWINPSAGIIGVFMIESTLASVDAATDAIRAYARSIGPPNSCPADLTGPALDGVPDDAVNAFDLNYYVALWLAGNLSADLTGPALDGVPDGTVNAFDLNYYIDLWLNNQGDCP